MNIRWLNWPEDGSRWTTLPGGELHIWCARGLAADAMVAEAPRLLTPDELAQAGHFHAADDRRRFVFRRSLLRLLLARYLSVEASAINLTRLPCGKPRLSVQPPAPGIEFSSSHTDQVAVLGFATGRSLGLDVECLRRAGDWPQITHRCLSENEERALRQLPLERRGVAFLRLWTAKEACLKESGAGLREDLTRIEVQPAIPAGDRARAVVRDSAERLGWSLRFFEAMPEHVVAVAWREDARSVGPNTEEGRIPSA